MYWNIFTRSCLVQVTVLYRLSTDNTAYGTAHKPKINVIRIFSLSQREQAAIVELGGQTELLLAWNTLGY